MKLQTWGIRELIYLSSSFTGLRWYLDFFFSPITPLIKEIVASGQFPYQDFVKEFESPFFNLVMPCTLLTLSWHLINTYRMTDTWSSH